MVPGARVRAVALESTVGGGSLPGEVLLSWGLAIERGSATGSGSAGAIAMALRTGEPAVIARVAGGRVLLDLRTIDPATDDRLGQALAAALARFASDARGASDATADPASDPASDPGSDPSAP